MERIDEEKGDEEGVEREREGYRGREEEGREREEKSAKEKEGEYTTFCDKKQKGKGRSEGARRRTRATNDAREKDERRASCSTLGQSWRIGPRAFTQAGRHVCRTKREGRNENQPKEMKGERSERKGRRASCSVEAQC